ncbi:class I SAM-dependent methyltransferase [Phaeovibrio sulfidiphilus]|uniref:Class I SAM-dependent methyltransferase n=1 Tax=Phaeovibrio sulfidiphilus TaxID=1220600 RepID=A0A8J6YM90_9PROT|nr:class I SAM-dependent methyltransferase [Phaeovibrio sulfidiphilus]MBE1237243.1 class I SAM-dependent methyltransferase [Phaeovibrio sulfidiphilus]
MSLPVTEETSQSLQSRAFLESEGDRWFERNRSALAEKPVFFDTEMIKRVLAPFQNDINTVLEIGCGGGAKLNELCQFFKASGFGVDPSASAVAHGNATYSSCQLSVATASKLPYEDDQFDLVVFGFCLCMIDRRDILKAVAEADRVLKQGGFLAILDFDPAFRHKRPYHHLPGLFCYKGPYPDLFTASGHYHPVCKESFSHTAPQFDKDSNERLSLSILYKEPDAYPTQELTAPAP